MNEEVRRNLMLENSLRHGLRHQEFGVFYQPKIDLATGGISGVEALVRWHRDSGEPVGPSEFISLAEDTGLIFPLGEWIFKTACRQARTWQNAGFEPLSMAVNLSPKQFRHEYLLRLVEATLDETGLPPNLLNLEITENIIMLDVDAATKTMARLAGMGVHISIDDFGIGYSSLNYLRRFPLNVLKIDKSFVQEIPHSADDIAIIKAILSIARSMNLKVVAEGVETLEQLAFVRDEGCHEMQGFLFSRPVPAERCTDILTEGARLPI
jgi:EAL domain-containing protein (putative c-di-GMP-specific phosphodiesterase class I)